MVGMGRGRWWDRVILGFVAIFFGLIIIVLPDITLRVFFILFGAFALLGGLLYVGMALFMRGRSLHRWVFLSQGVVGVLVGVLAIFWPEATMVLLAYIVALSALYLGIMEIFAAFYSPRLYLPMFSQLGKGMMVLSGAISIIFGILLILFPEEGILALLWLVGALIALFGVFNIILGFQARQVSRF